MMCASLARANTREAAGRKLAIKTLWRAAGRAGEPANLSYEGMRWNALYKSPTIESPQLKASKLKLVIFLPGADRHSDWIIDYADNLCLDRGLTHYDPEQKTWLLPELGGSEATGAATRLSNYVRGLQPAGRPGALKKYEDHAVKDLPPNPTAGGFRHPNLIFTYTYTYTYTYTCMHMYLHTYFL